MEINYLGPYQVAQAFLPVLANTAKRHSMGVDKPSLIFVNSFASKVGVCTNNPVPFRQPSLRCAHTMILLHGFNCTPVSLALCAQVPVQYMSAFTASKSALAGLTTAIRPEVEAQGVHVGQVHPGVS